MDIVRSLSGLVRVNVTSADVPGLLDALAKANIPILYASSGNEMELTFTVFRRYYRTLESLCTERGDAVTLQGREGIYWHIRKVIHRPVLLVGLLLLTAIMLWVPSRVFFVRVEGNERIPARQIITAAEENGVHFGASRRAVRSEEVKNALLEAVPELQWAGVNTYGCVAVITVRENSMEADSPLSYTVSSIISVCDGIVFSATAANGTLLCQPGQAVCRGQILISAYTDCGLSIRAGRAEGEIFARTMHKIQVLSPATCFERLETTGQQHNFSLIIGKKRINLWKGSGISGATCGRMYEEYYITLPGGFQLPLALAKETVSYYETATVSLAPEAGMEDFAGDYLLSQMISGTILEGEVSFPENDGRCILEGTYLCTEMIGRQKAEEIGELHE